MDYTVHGVKKELDTTEQLSLSLYYFIYLFFGWAVWHVGS